MTLPLTRRQALIALGFVTAAIVFLLTTGHAFADSVGIPVIPVVPNDSTVTVAPALYSLIAGLATPLLTGLIMKITAHSALTAVVNALLVALAAVVGQIVVGAGSFALLNTVVMGAVIFVVNVASYAGLWSPTVGPNFSKVSPTIANAGIGPAAPNQAG